MNKSCFIYIPLIIIISCILVLLPGCTPSTQTVQPSSVASLIINTNIPVLPTKTKVPTRISTSTFTPQPTLSYMDAQIKILDLLQNNAGCKLPCWWGFMPGETSIQEIQDFVEPLVNSINWKSFDNQGGGIIFLNPHTQTLDYSLLLSFTASNGNINSIDIDGIEAYDIDGLLTYRIPEFLNTYGQPDEIWIRTFKPNPDEKKTDTFDLIGFYGKQGIIAYWRGTGEVQYSLIHGCIDSSPSLNLWFPDPSIATITDTSKLFDPILPGFARNIKEASGMNEEAFYAEFKGIEGPVCLDTPVDLWCDVYSCGNPPTPTP